MTNSETTRQRPGGSASLAGHTVARVGFGAMQLAERHGAPPADPATAVAVLRRAVESGVDHIDTAQFYGDGTANRLIRTALAPYDPNLVLVSKIGAVRDPAHGLIAAQRPEQLRAQIEENLTALGIDRLPVVNLRRADAPPGIVAVGDQRVDLDSQLAELTALRDQGMIGGIGLSAVDADQLRGALPAGIACVQNLYNLLDRTNEPVLALCRTHQVAWVPFFPLGSGFPNRPKVTEHPAVRAAAAAARRTPAQIALAWLLGHYDNTLVIPGTGDPAHLDQNIAAGAIELDEPTRAELDDIVSATA